MRRRRAALGLAFGLLACAAPGAVAPVPAGLGAAAGFLDSVIADGVAPGAVLGVSLAGCHYYHGAGRLGQDDATRPDSTTIYDLASLTKVIGLTTAAMAAVERRALTLDAPVARYVPTFRDSAATIRHLLTHTSGLPAWRPLYQEAPTRAAALALVDATPLAATPGDTFVYSDLGAILLTQAVEQALGARIDTLVQRLLADPLHLRETRYLPPPSWRHRIAPTEDDPWRGRVLRGEVHDENAARLDGVSGHAGLFSSARDLLRIGDWLLEGLGTARDAPCAGAALPPGPAALSGFIRRQDLPPGSSRALGWDTPSGVSSAGTLMSRTSFGHTGFTGTSIWIDPTRRLVVVLLANRVHPTRDNPRFGPVRGQVADRVVRGLGIEALSR
ncbi:MAG: beta-lactamase family protein [Gemmatimonadales bacterium]|nr:beta-lactamase family protein [Gemmatimonadales bacterium]